MATAHTINALLQRAVDLLDQAAGEIRDAPLNPTSKNIRHIGRALSEVFEIQFQIHALHPELQPPYMKGPSKDPAKVLTWTLERCKVFEEAGELRTAIAFLQQFLAKETGAEQRAVAEAEIRRLEERDA